MCVCVRPHLIQGARGKLKIKMQAKPSSGLKDALTTVACQTHKYAVFTIVPISMGIDAPPKKRCKEILYTHPLMHTHTSVKYLRLLPSRPRHGWLPGRHLRAWFPSMCVCVYVYMCVDVVFLIRNN